MISCLSKTKLFDDRLVRRGKRQPTLRIDKGPFTVATFTPVARALSLSLSLRPTPIAAVFISTEKRRELDISQVRGESVLAKNKTEAAREKQPGHDGNERETQRWPKGGMHLARTHR